MATYRQIHIKIWSSPDFQKLSSHSKFIFIYLFSNSHRNESALYRITPKTISNETDIPVDEVIKSLQEIESINLIKYDCEQNIVWVINAVKYQKLSPNEVTGIRNNLASINHDFVSTFEGYYNELLSTYEVPSGSSKVPSGKGKGKGKGKDKGKSNTLFEEFWSIYPNKKSKGQAETTWNKISPDNDLFEKIIEGLKRAKTSRKWTKDNGDFIPHPSTWLNAKGWLDEESEETTSWADAYTGPVVVTGRVKELEPGYGDV